MAGSKRQPKRWQDFVHIERRYRRSVHLERDFSDTDSLAGYVVTPLIVATLGRICEGLASGGGRAWSFTGPYGSGKSAFAVFLAHLLHFSENSGIRAREMLGSAAPDLNRTLAAVGAKCRLVPILATGDRSSLEAIVLRGLSDAGREFWRSGPKPKLLAQIDKMIVRSERGDRLGSKEVVRLVEEFVVKIADSSKGGSGVLLLLDEAGKALEYAAHHPDRADVQLLQELAEAANRSGDHPLVVGVLLHQAFEQYAARLGTSQRNEWAKVQGRFEDVAFQEPADQLLHLIGKAIGLHSLPFDVKARIQSTIDDLVAVVSPPGIPDKAKLGERLSRTLPLHPVTALLLGPLFRSQASQNERSLFAFLASAEPGAFQDFLGTPVQEDGAIQTYRPDRLYNYLAATLGERLYRSGGRHWAQVDSALARLRKDASELDARLVKTIGLLGLLGEGAGVSASERVLQLALSDDRHVTNTQVSESLERLTADSVIVFRRFKNAYQIWDGSDLDLEQRLRTAIVNLDPRAQLIPLLQRSVPPRPMLARRHLFESGTLRYFDVCYGDESAIDGEWAAPKTDADGIVWILVPSSDTAAFDLKARLNRTETWALQGGSSRPAVVGVMDEVGRLREAAIELAALEWVTGHTPELEGDPIARKELAGRILDAESTMRQELAGLVSGDRAAAWYYRGKVLSALNGRQLTAHLSDICDEAYAQAPRVLNELLNRSQLSSAAAAARRELLAAMISKKDQPRFGIEGYPPELSMYRSLFEEHGLHREKDGKWVLSHPRTRVVGSLAPAVRHIEKALGENGARLRLRTLFSDLKRPPFGIKEGVIPVLVVWFLVQQEAEVALYEEGAFVPTLNGPVIERLLKHPDKFEVQRFELSGAREAFAEQLMGREGAADAGPLPMARAFVKAVQELPPFGKTTREVSERAQAIREAILRAKEPGTLIFSDLPQACGYPPVTSGKRSSLPNHLVADLRSALKELRSAYPQLLHKIGEHIAGAFEIPGDPETVRAELSARCRRLTSLASDQHLKTFLVRAGGEYPDLTSWTVSVGTLLGGRPPETWADLDLQKMSVNLSMIARKFAALEAAFLAHDRAGLPDGAVALRVSVTEAGAQEAERVVLIRSNERIGVETIAARLRAAVLSERGDSSREAVVAGLAMVVREFVSELDEDVRAKEGVEK